MRPQSLIFGAVAAFLLVLGVAWQWGAVTALFDGNVEAQENSGLEEMVIGDMDAPVTIIEYASLTCTHCAAFHTETLPLLERDYINQGKVRLVYRDYPLDQWAVAASMLARCLPSERYFPFIKILYDHQRTWVLSRDRKEALLNLARQAGMGREIFDSCLRNEDLLKSLHAMRKHASEHLSVNSTPTLFINGEKIEGNEPYGKLRRVIERHLN